MKEFKINNHNNISLNIIEGLPIDDPKAIVINVHGIGAHFQEIFESEDNISYRDSLFYPNNIKLYGLEFHGHGKSDGIRCSIDNFDDLVEDLHCLILYVKKKYKDSVPIFIIAESMGGAVAIKYNIKYQHETRIKGYILMCPMCGIDESLKPHPIMVSILLNLSKFFPTLQALDTGSQISCWCKNKKFLEAKEKSKFCYKGKFRLNTARECHNTSVWIKENGKLFNAPLFVLHGLDDKITDPNLSIKFFNESPNPIKEIYLPKGTNHVLSLGVDDNDLHPKLVWLKVLNWINNLI